MAGGWMRDGAVRIDDIAPTRSARRALACRWREQRWCVECGEDIPERRNAMLGVKRCVECQSGRTPSRSGFNRRGSKDSQLR